MELGEILDLHYEKEMKVTTLRVAPLTIYAALSGNLLAKWSPEMIGIQRIVRRRCVTYIET